MNKVSGILRIKNDGMFVRECIESCIDALDELIVTHNDCTDNSVEEIEKMLLQYPDKIRVYEYPYKVYGLNLTQEEYEYAASLPDDSKHLFSSYSNFALDKVTGDYAMLIDADQIYFTDHLKEWCDFLRKCKPQKMTFKAGVGWMFQLYLSLFRRLSFRYGIVVPMLPEKLVKAAYPYYLSYAKYLFSHDRACLTMSGINMMEDNEQLISAGKDYKEVRMPSSFNGVGDHFMFRVSDATRFERLILPEFNKNKSFGLAVGEALRHPYRLMYLGFFWKHLTTMRPSTINKFRKLHSEHPDSFIPLNKFQKMSYYEIMCNSSENIFMLPHRIHFALVYKACKEQLFDALNTQCIKKS